MKLTLLALTAALVTTPVLAQQTDPHAGHGQTTPKPLTQDAATPVVQMPLNEKIPPDATGALEALKRSPRHHEWVDIKVPGSTTPIKSFVVYPERKDKAGVVIVIHEIFGLSDWVRGVADQLAEDGFIAIAPDLLSGKGPNGGGTADLGDQVTQVIRTLTPDDVVSKLNAVREYGLKLPAANGKSGVVGYCWGGSASFNYAIAQPTLNAAVVYYGSSPSDVTAYASIKAPVLGLYGGNDARVNATIPTAEEHMKKHGKVYEPNTFEGAGHGFLRQQSGADGANLKATEKAWPLTIGFFRTHLK
ncbi:MAG TPA: dienelactone hydrolase family protein [Vicinamibacterales bacterium]|nr:dienelactone hydrolase family protein [Vicinamibacterales bacterium]